MRKMQHSEFRHRIDPYFAFTRVPLRACEQKNRARIIYWFLTKTKFDPDQAAV
jgi:hypothetical protein